VPDVPEIYQEPKMTVSSICPVKRRKKEKKKKENKKNTKEQKNF
jgi:hypothetical protein